MSFREKIAWASLLATSGIYGWYFLSLWSALRADTANGGEFLGKFVLSVIVLVIVQIVLAIVLAIASPKEAQAPLDEREKLIELKAGQIGYFVLSLLVMTVALGAPVAAGFAPHLMTGTPEAFVTAFLMANGILLAVVIADLTRWAGLIVRYRLAA